MGGQHTYIVTYVSEVLTSQSDVKIRSLRSKELKKNKKKSRRNKWGSQGNEPILEPKHPKKKEYLD